MSLSSIPDVPLFKGKNSQQKFEATAGKNTSQQEVTEKRSSLSAGADNVAVSGTAVHRSASGGGSVALSTGLDRVSAEELLQQTIESIHANSKAALRLYEPNSENATRLLQEA